MTRSAWSKSPEGRLKAPKPALLDALTGRITDHHRFMIKMHLQQVESLEEAVRELEARADQGFVVPRSSA